MMFDHRSSRWTEMAKRCKARDARANAPCGICSGRYGPIDYAAQPGDPLGYEADHIIPASAAPQLAYSFDNIQASHSLCNRRKGRKRGLEFREIGEWQGGDVGLGTASREW